MSPKKSPRFLATKCIILLGTISLPVHASISDVPSSSRRCIWSCQEGRATSRGPVRRDGLRFEAMLLKSNYSLARDHVRWLFLSGGYKAKVLAQPPSEELKHVEWDGWAFAGVGDTTAFLAFDPTDSFTGAAAALPPIKARALPCEVVRVRPLDSRWYAVLFYTDTYWGQGACK